MASSLLKSHISARICSYSAAGRSRHKKGGKMMERRASHSRGERLGESKNEMQILLDGFTHLKEAELFRIDRPSPPSPNSLHGVKRVSSLLDQRDCN